MDLAGRRSARHRRAGADEVVDDDDAASGHVAGKDLASDLAHAAAFVHETFRNRTAEHCLECLSKELRPLGAADVRRDDGGGAIPDLGKEI